jgi:hypothetical protein
MNSSTSLPIGKTLPLSSKTRRSLKKPRRNAFVIRFPSSPSSSEQKATYHQSILQVIQEERLEHLIDSAISLTKDHYTVSHHRRITMNDFDDKSRYDNSDNKTEHVDDHHTSPMTTEKESSSSSSTLELLNDFSDLQLSSSWNNKNRQQIQQSEQGPR